MVRQLLERKQLVRQLLVRQLLERKQLVRQLVERQLLVRRGVGLMLRPGHREGLGGSGLHRNHPKELSGLLERVPIGTRGVGRLDDGKRGLM